MSKKNIFQQTIQNIFSLGSLEKVDKPALRPRQISEIGQHYSKRTSIDPATGHTSETQLPSAAFAPSGHYISDTDNGGLLGECITCREEFESEGTPDLITLVAKEGGGGACAGCQNVFCSEHGAADSEGTFWCEGCAQQERSKQIKAAALKALAGKLKDIFRGEKDE